jgi:hypothetical protein
MTLDSKAYFPRYLCTILRMRHNHRSRLCTPAVSPHHARDRRAARHELNGDFIHADKSF